MILFPFRRRGTFGLFAAFALATLPVATATGGSPSPAPVPETSDSTLEQRAQKAMDRLAQIEAAKEKLEKATGEIPQPDPGQIESMARSRNAAAAQFTEAQHQLASLITDKLPATLSIADLNRKLAEAQKKRDEIAGKLLAAEKQKQQKNDSGGIPETVLRKNMKPVTLLLVRNHIVPTRKPYFSFSSGYSGTTRAGERLPLVRVHRAQEGVAITDAIKQGGALDKLIAEDKSKPDTHIFRILVCADSIPSFQILAKAIGSRGFDYNWDTAKDEDQYIPANGGPGSTEQWVTPGAR